MNIKISKLFIRLFALSLLTISITFAAVNLQSEDNKETTNYKNMSLSELQIEVEKRSTNNTLPYEMGLELMNRWSNEKREVQ